MYRFKSPYTEKKLKHSKSLQNPSFQFNFSSISEMDAAFESFCKESQCNLSYNLFSLSKIDKHFLEENEKNKKVPEESGSPSKQPHKKSVLKDKIIEVYKKQKTQSNCGITNPVVKMFGNNLIAAIFQSLIIKTIEELFDLHIEDPLNYSHRVLESFGISYSTIKNLKTQEEKNNFILESMNNIIDRLLQSWKEKIEIQEKHAINAEKLYESIKKEHFKDCQDNFKWLTIKTKYQDLQKKLKTLIVQKLNDYENQIKIIEVLKERHSRRSSLQRITSEDCKITLKNIHPPSTIEMLKKNIVNSEAITTRRTLSSPKAPKSLNQSPQATIGFNLSDKRGQTAKNFTRRSMFYEWKLNQNPESEEEKKLNDFLAGEIQSKSLRNLKEKELFEFTWDEDLETVFKTFQKNSKNLFIHEKNTGKWHLLAMKKIAQSIFSENKKDKERNQLLKIYSEGGQLTKDEARFLSDTSDLLNSCIDKHFFQRAVNIIDPSILHYMELNLAEQIIKQHKAMEEITIMARKEFYKSKNELIVSKIAYKDAEKMKLLEHERRKGELLKKQKVFIFAMNKSEQNEKIKKIKKEEKLYNDINYNHSTYSDYEKELNKEKTIQSLKKLEISKKLMEPKNQINFENFNHPSIVKHRYHPSSKLFYYNRKEIMERNDAEYYIKSLQKNQEEFKILTNSPQVLRMPQSFRAFYSGGPTSFLKKEQLYNTFSGETIRPLKKKELNSIIKIQSRVRGMIERRKHKERLENKIRNDYLEMSERVNYSKDLSQIKTTTNKTTQDKSLLRTDTAFSMNMFSSTRTHKKMASTSSDLSEKTREALKRFKIREKSAKKNELFITAQKFRSFNSSLAFCYSKKELNVHDNLKNTPLYYAAKNCNLDFCEYLLENGANPNEVCFAGNTPFHMAMKTNKSEVISLFLKYNPDFHIENENNETPLDVCEERILTIFNLLKKKAERKNKIDSVSENLRRESLLQTEKSLNSTTNSEIKAKKNLSFKKKLVEVL